MAPFVTLALIALVSTFSIIGFQDEHWKRKYSFSIEAVVRRKEYYRFISSGFVHVSWMHLIVNMIVLFSFGSGLEIAMGRLQMPVIFFASLVGGNVLAYFIHRHHNGYNSAGASGAVSGLVFALIALHPNNAIPIIQVPIWVFGLAYVIYTIYAIRSQKTDLGHAAHLGGALIGMAVSVLFHLEILASNWPAITAIAIPGIALILIMVKWPHLILIDRRLQQRQYSMDDQYNIRKSDKKEEIDRILDKINSKGMGSLSRKEKELLDEYSRS